MAIIAADAALIVYLKQSALADSTRETKNLSYVLALQADRTFQSAQLIANNLVDRFGASRANNQAGFRDIVTGQAVHELLRDKLSGQSHLANIVVIGADGKLLNRARAGASSSIDLSSRDYFTELSGSPHKLSYISAPFKSQTTGSQNIVLAHRVSGANGEFLGVIGVIIELRTLEQMYAQISLGRQGSIAIARSDGVLLARHPRVHQPQDVSLATSPLFQNFVFKGVNGVLRQKSWVDNVDRIIAIAATDHFPVVISVSSAVEEVLAPWQRQKVALLLLGLWVIAAVALILALLARHSAERAQTTGKLAAARERELAQGAAEKEHKLFRAAISSMGQGLVMFDAAESLIVCNDRYAELYKLPKHLTVPGTPRASILRHRAEVGTDKVGQSLFRHASSYTKHNRSHSLKDGRIISVLHRPMPGGGWVSTHEDITDRRRSEDRISYMAAHDALTGLPNRFAFRDRLQASLTEARRGKQFALLYVDLDRFKSVNDTLGHPVGDALLAQVADRLRSTGKGHLIARLGGDEFVVIQKLHEGIRDAAALASQIISGLSDPYPMDGRHVTIGATIGISITSAEVQTVDDILKKADLALFHAKAQERGSFCFFEAWMEAAVDARQTLERELQQAINREELELYYQPIVLLSTQDVVGYEALIRWNHPARGLLGPGEFIPLAEETGLIVPIGEWALKTACVEASRWRDDLRVSVNVSAVQFQSWNLVDAVVQALRGASLDARRLEIEVTETVLLKDAEGSLALLHKLRALGIRIAMDDFGTGYSSLSYLRLFPFDKLKIDQCFIKELGKSSECAAIVRASTSLAASLGMTTTAEGIETEQQMIRAASEGCIEGQGYLFAKPKPASQIAAHSDQQTRRLA